MKKQLKERWPCMVGLSFFILLDGVVTLLGQSEGYWTNQSSPNERSAIGYIFLEYSPIVFFTGIILYAGIQSFFALIIPRFFSLILSITMIVGHSEAAFTWHFKFGLSEWTHVLYGPAVAFVIIYICCTQYGIKITKDWLTNECKGTSRGCAPSGP
jgi:hypothetical protein